MKPSILRKIFGTAFGVTMFYSVAFLLEERFPKTDIPIVMLLGYWVMLICIAVAERVSGEGRQ